MGAFPIRRSLEKIKGIGNEGNIKTKEFFVPIHSVVGIFEDGIPTFIGVNVARVGVMGAVTDTPAVIGNEDGNMGKMPDQIVQPFEFGERTVTAIVADDE